MDAKQQVVVAIAVAVGLSLFGCDRGDIPHGKRELTVFVAASMADVVERIGAAYQRETGVAVRCNVAASGVLRTQIVGGASCDVFISADRVEMDIAVSAGVIVDNSVRAIAGNTLVIAARKDSRRQLKGPRDLIGGENVRIAIGDPGYVPAGRYAKSFLERDELWIPLADRLVFADNVRVALTYLRTGQADFAFVYETDLTGGKECEVVYRFDAETERVACFAGVCRNAPNADAASRFVKTLRSKQAADVWRQFGFAPVALEP